MEKKIKGNRARFGLQAGAILLVLGLAAAALGTAVGLRAQTDTPASQAYESLKLLTEAFYEINTKFVKQKGETEIVYGALRGLAASLDPDSSFLTPKEYKDYQASAPKTLAEAGMDLVIKDGLPMVIGVLQGGPAWEAGVRPGDHILKINDVLAHDLSTLEVVRRFQGEAGTALKLQLIRNGMVKPLDLTVTLKPLNLVSVSSQVLPEGYAYLRVGFFTDNTAQELAETLKELSRRQPPIKGIILDLRNNARGSVEQAVKVGDALLGDKVIVRTKGRDAASDLAFSGRAKATLAPSLPLVALVDGGTARAAEIIAGALQDNGRATTLGVKTFGLCGQTRPLPLDDGSALIITVTQCYTPNGQKIPGKGLEPQVPGVKAKGDQEGVPAPVGLAPDQDPWVKQAVGLLKSGKTKQMAKDAGPR
jgi:carboxyl-terminal processing protease